MSCRRGARIFKKDFGTYSEFVGARRVTRSKLDADNLQILGAIVQDLSVWAVWRSGFVHTYVTIFKIKSTSSECLHSRGGNVRDT